MAEVPKMIVRLKASKSRALGNISADEFDPEKHEKVEEGAPAAPPPAPEGVPKTPEEPPRRR